MKTPNRKSIFFLAPFIIGFILSGIALAQDAGQHDLDDDGINDADDLETIVSTPKTLEAGDHTFKNLVITNSAVLTLNSDPSLEGFKGVKINAENLTIDEGASISAAGKGYATGDPPSTYDGNGPGGGKGGIGRAGCGAGYGGKGTDGWENPGGGGSTYGSLTQPLDLGSAGGATKHFGITYGGNGGGAIFVNLSDTLTNNGAILANGLKGGDATGYGAAGGGSGGSIYIITKALNGAGVINADGGDGGTSDNIPYVKGGGGGGGRIAIYSINNPNFTGTISAKGGRGFDAGGIGTIIGFYGPSYENIVVYSGAFDFSGDYGDFTLTGETSSVSISSDSNFRNLSLSSSANLAIEPNTVINAANLAMASSTLTNNGVLNITGNSLELDSGTLTTVTGTTSLPSAVTIRGNFNYNGLLETTTLTVKQGATLSHSPNNDTKQYWLNVAAANLIIEQGGLIDVSGKGYATGNPPYTYDGNGPGGGRGGIGRAGCGAGYGGKGADGWENQGGGSAYGSLTQPLDLGSAGGATKQWGVTYGGNGGGAIFLNISDTLTNNGAILANGLTGGSGSGYDAAGGGAGGSIYIITKALNGTGVINADGGDGGTSDNIPYVKGGGGGGGRIAIYSINNPNFTGTISAKGGRGFENGEDGSKLAYGPSDSPLTNSELQEESATESTLIETLLIQRTGLEATISGDLTGTLNFINLEHVLIDSGSFAGKGFSRGNWSADIEGISYTGSWQGMMYKKPDEKKIYLKGTLSGGLKGVVDGYLLESVEGSNVFDQYHATWTLSQVGLDIVFAKLTLTGTVTYLDTDEYPSQELYLLQTSIKGESSGYHEGPLDIVLTHIRINNEDNPYYGQGFSVISYISGTVSGEGWTYDKLITPGRVGLKGFFIDPLLGIVSATLDETVTPRKLHLTIERLDIGLPPAPILRVKVWGPERVSPGQTINYIIEYRNDGVKAAGETLLFVALDYNLKYLSASEGAFYNDILNTVDWNLGNLSAKSSGYLSIQSEAVWGLPLGTTLETDAIINELLPHSEKKGIFINGFGLNVGNKRNEGYAKTCEDFASKRDLEWIEAYNTGSRAGDIAEARKAFEGIATEHNGLLNEKVTGGFTYETAMGYSAGTVTVMTAVMQGKLKTKELVLISPVLIDTNTLIFMHMFLGVEKIIIYQSEEDKLFAGELYQLKIPKDDPLRNESWLEVIDMDDVKHAFWLQELNNKDNKNKESMSSSTPSAITTARDPNEKLVSPEGDVGPGDRLGYAINYENEGEGIAYGVYITDTLDEDLNDSALVVNDGGTYDVDTRTITWFIGEVGSGEEGSVHFSVNVKENIQGNAEVINFATVYFPSVPEATRTNGTVNPIITASLDTTPPVTAISTSPSANNAGWNKEDVTVNLIATDETGGSGVKELHYRLTGAVTREETISGQTAQILLTTEGATNISYWAVDNAGNIEVAKSRMVKIDKTPPTITTQILPEPNSYGWNNTDVTVSFNATDALSGVDIVTDPISVTTEGKNQYIGGEAIDTAGNKATAFIMLNIDKTPPILNSIGNKNINEGGLLKFTISATDALSGQIIYSAESLPSNATFANQTFTWRPSYLQSGVYQVTFIAKDIAGNSDSEVVTITVNNILVPDITIDKIRYMPTTPYDGFYVYFIVYIQNIGEAKAKPFYIDYYIDGIKKGTKKVYVSIQPKMKYIIILYWKAEEGEHTLKVVADSTNIIPELREDNNMKEIIVSVRKWKR